MRKANGKTMYLKPWARIVIIIFLDVLIVLSLFFIYKGYNKKVNGKKYYYNTNGQIDYKVYLLPNDFYEEEYLGMNKQYTSELIDYVDINLKYLYDGSQKSDINYNYDVTATIKGEYEKDEGKSEIWTKKYTLINKVEDEKKDSTSFNIDQNVKINYKEYNDVVNDFKRNFRLAIDAYLDVKMNITYTTKIDGITKKLDKTDTVELTIPLTSNTMKITANNKSKHNVLEDTIKNTKDTKMLIIGYILLLITFILSLLTLSLVFRTKKNLYLDEIKRLMKNYAEIIVEVKDMPNIKDLEIIDIKTFDDMIDLEEELKIPIFYYEVIYDNVSWFMIITETKMYRYIVNRNELKG